MSVVEMFEYGSGKYYYCTSCGAFVGTHVPRPTEALGILSNAPMRAAKKKCHALFDIRWKDAKRRGAIVTVRYDGNMMKIKNSINGSRDGWMSFPEGYFDERTIKLSAEDKNKLHECLRSLDFDSFTTSPDLFRNFGAAGFCISNRFLCRFSNGKGFECLSPRCDGFNTLVEVVKNIVEIN